MTLDVKIPEYKSNELDITTLEYTDFHGIIIGIKNMEPVLYIIQDGSMWVATNNIQLEGESICSDEYILPLVQYLINKGYCDSFKAEKFK